MINAWPLPLCWEQRDVGCLLALGRRGCVGINPIPIQSRWFFHGVTVSGAILVIPFSIALAVQEPGTWVVSVSIPLVWPALKIMAPSNVLPDFTVTAAPPIAAGASSVASTSRPGPLASGVE